MGRKRANLIKRAELWVKKGYAERTLKDYEPFLKVRDVPSKGRSHRVVSWTVKRQHHLLSDFELSIFYAADYSKSVVDIREQFPLLPLEETQDIANFLGIKHPSHRGGLHVMSTDFVLTYADGSVRPVAGKLSQELENLRTQQKLDIEQFYWSRRDTKNWSICTEKQISKPLTQAVQWVHSYQDPSGIEPEEHDMTDVISSLKELFLSRPQTSIAKVCELQDQACSLKTGTSLSVVRHALASRIWPVDLTNGIDTLKPMPWINHP